MCLGPVSGTAAHPRWNGHRTLLSVSAQSCRREDTFAFSDNKHLPLGLCVLAQAVTLFGWKALPHFTNWKTHILQGSAQSFLLS